MTVITAIPEPPGLPFLGNIRNIDDKNLIGSLESLAEQHGEIYRLRFPGRTLVVVSTQALVNELCDEKRFKKAVGGALNEMRNCIHDGLFTAREGEPNWGIAHRVLLPAFGPLSIKEMFQEMHSVASQLALKMARYGPDSSINASEDFTRLTLDTIALCSMGFRFNSFYSSTLHPFVQAMSDFLLESGTKTRRIPFLPSFFYRKRDEKYASDIDTLRKTAGQVLESRKAEPDNKRKDLLTAMLRGVDSLTGQHMTDESIMDNLITFLVAGHETTSGMLSFAFFELLKHPEAYRKAQQEVDDTVGQGTIQIEHLSKLPYLNAVLRETLRLHGTVPLFLVTPREDTIVGGRYPVKKDEVLLLLLAKSQLDPSVFGSSANEFEPERMLEDEFHRLQREHPNCWKPFGNGMRGCIGRPFAWQEALLVMTMLLQNFELTFSNPAYQLKVKQTLSLKPDDFLMKASLRHDQTPTDLEYRLAGSTNGKVLRRVIGSGTSEAHTSSGLPLSILYGSNSGTCESLAHRLATDSASHGFRVMTLDSLDSAIDSLPTDQPVIIITTSYDGQPPDNSKKFVAHLETVDSATSPLKGVTYAVFGCGHHDWTQTFHRIPTLVDARVQELGGDRIAPLGLVDVAVDDVFSEFEVWQDEVFWPAIKKRYGGNRVDSPQRPENPISVTVSSTRSSILRQDVKLAAVTSVCDLTTEGEPLKRHVEVQLPKAVSYMPGDYLAILAVNPRETVLRAMRYFGLAIDAQLTISTDTHVPLPSDGPVSAYEVFSSYVELSQIATKRNLSTLAQTSSDEDVRSSLDRLASAEYNEHISSKRISVLDLLERYPSLNLSISSFLSMLPPMRVRQYSISSSPFLSPHHASITFSVLTGPSLSGSGTFTGVASSYLSTIQERDAIQFAIRPFRGGFHLENLETTPIICIGAGSGIAPFRGFMQTREPMHKEGRHLAPAMLFFGCRQKGRDDLYTDELNAWQESGLVEVQRAYSRHPEESSGCRYVQERVWEQRGRFWELWKQGAKVYVCGSTGGAEGVKETMIKMKQEMAGADGETAKPDEAREWFEGLRGEQYVVDVFE